MTLIASAPADPPHFESPSSSSVDSLIIGSPQKSPSKHQFEPLERWDKATMVRWENCQELNLDIK